MPSAPPDSDDGYTLPREMLHDDRGLKIGDGHLDSDRINLHLIGSLTPPIIVVLIVAPLHRSNPSRAACAIRTSSGSV
jgi:hypothetical protein